MDKGKIIRYCDKIIEISWYVVAFFIPISRGFIESFIGLAIAAWLIKKVISKAKFRDTFYFNYLKLPILFYVIIAFISAVFSTNKIISFNHLLLKTLEYFLLFFIIVETVDKRILKNILAVLVISVSLIGIDGVFQYFTRFDFFRLRRVNIDIPWRITGPFNIATDFANYVVTLLPVVASLSFLKFKKLWIKPVLVTSSLVLFICLVINASRSAWLALLLSIPFVAVLRNKKLFILSIVILSLTLCISPLLSHNIQSRLVHFFEFNEGAASSHRQILWGMGLNMLKEKPILGRLKEEHR